MYEAQRTDWTCPVIATIVENKMIFFLFRNIEFSVKCTITAGVQNQKFVLALMTDSMVESIGTGGMEYVRPVTVRMKRESALFSLASTVKSLTKDTPNKDLLL